MIETPRVLSGTEVRDALSTKSEKEWIDFSAPTWVDRNLYHNIRETLLERLGLKSDLEEISAMGGGAVAGAIGGVKKDNETLIREVREFINSDRMKFYMSIEEDKFREIIREAVKKHISEEVKQRVGEEKLRKTVREMILKEAKMNVNSPHFSTGINVLRSLLKKIVPVIEDDYKLLTTNKFQRDSFKAHIISGIDGTLSREEAVDVPMSEFEKVGAEAQAQAQPSPEPGVEITEAPDDAEALESGIPREDDGVQVSVGEDDVAPVQDDDPRKEKFIPIEDEEVKTSDEPDFEPMSEDEFGLAGQDETGRNMAYQTYKKIEKEIIRSYSLLSSDADRAIFKEYLLMNVELYFEKFEGELTPMIDQDKAEGRVPEEQNTEEF